MILFDSGMGTHPNNTLTCSGSYKRTLYAESHFLSISKSFNTLSLFLQVISINLLRISATPISFPLSKFSPFNRSITSCLFKFNFAFRFKHVGLFNLLSTEFLTLSANAGRSVDTVKSTSLRYQKILPIKFHLAYFQLP